MPGTARHKRGNSYPFDWQLRPRVRYRKRSTLSAETFGQEILMVATEIRFRVSEGSEPRGRPRGGRCRPQPAAGVREHVSNLLIGQLLDELVKLLTVIAHTDRLPIPTDNSAQASRGASGNHMGTTRNARDRTTRVKQNGLHDTECHADVRKRLP